jgi:hypothetical protein
MGLEAEYKIKEGGNSLSGKILLKGHISSFAETAS